MKKIWLIVFAALLTLTIVFTFMLFPIAGAGPKKTAGIAAVSIAFAAMAALILLQRRWDHNDAEIINNSVVIVSVIHILLQTAMLYLLSGSPLKDLAVIGIHTATLVVFFTVVALTGVLKKDVLMHSSSAEHDFIAYLGREYTAARIAACDEDTEAAFETLRQLIAASPHETAGDLSRLEEAILSAVHEAKNTGSPEERNQLLSEAARLLKKRNAAA